MNEKWTPEKFTIMCVQEEERIKCNNSGVDSHQKKKNFAPKPYAPKIEDKGEAMSMSSEPPIDKD
jgi:hypothetical protein